MTIFTNLMQTKNATPLLTPAQKTFNRLRIKIKSLQEKQAGRVQELDESLQFYYAKIKPEEDVLCKLFIERIKATYKFYSKKYFSKKELVALKELIIDDLDVVIGMSEDLNLPIEIKAIFKALNNVDFDGAASEELAFMKDEMQDMFKEKFGVDIDLSDINTGLSQEAIIQKMFNSIGKAMEDLEDASKKDTSKKTKKMQEKELKKLVFEEMQKKSLNSIYKELSRALHPDLELNNDKKAWKEELMKKLTVSYKNKDLYALLMLEMEYLNRSTEQIQLQSDEQIDLYNTILKDQQRTLQDSIDMLLMHPKYIPIQRFYKNGDNVKTQYETLKTNIKMVQGNIADLQTPEGLAILKEALKERLMMSAEASFNETLLDLFKR